MEHSLSTASSLHQEAVSEGKRVEELPATSNTTEIDENRTNPASIDLATQTSLNSVVSCTSASSTCTDVQSPPSPESRQPPGAVGEPPRAAAGGGDGEEKAPVPPPRRRRKKKMLQKPPSLEHLEVGCGCARISMMTYLKGSRMAQISASYIAPGLLVHGFWPESDCS